MKTRITAIVFSCITSFGLGGCGQLGPLYLPDSNGNVITRPTRTPPATTSPAPVTPVPATPAPAPQGAGRGV